MRRRTLPTALTAVGLATVLAFGTSPAPASPPPASGGQLPTPKGGKLAPADRTALARRAARHQRVSVMVLADVGQGAELAADVRAKGGTVTSADDAAGWVVASMPAGRALELERAGLVRALGIDRAVSIPRDRTATGRPDPWSPRSPRSPRSVAMAAAGQPGARRPSAGTGKVNPWLPTGDIGAPQFVGGHGRWDGRGVKLAVLDTGVDWTAAGLQRTTTGGRKVTRWQDTTGEGLVRTDTVVQVDGRSFTAAGTSWTLPAGLTVRRARFGILAESSLAPKGEGNTLAQDLNRDGDPLDRFGVAVVGSAGQGLTVYVDTDQDHSFADEGTLRDYNQAHATDTFGTDDPATPGAREVLAFGVLACSARPDNPCAAPLGAGDEPGDAWTLAFDGGTHGTHVASIAAGHDFGPGGADFSGAAPGAEVWAVRVLRSNGSGTSASIGDGIVSAASQGADVINLSVGGLSLINVGAPLDPAATLIDNVSRAYGVAFAISAGNDGPGVNTVSSPGTAAGAVTVGASITPRTWDVNYDRPGVPSEGLLYFSATGPLEDGGFKPDVVAPGSAMASVPAWQDWTADLFPAGRLPAGYAVYQGTSMASPQVAGAQALLLSAARQTGTPSSPHALQRALELGARRLDGGSYTYQPAEVGHGLVQVGSAWAWLRRIGTTERDVASVTGNFTLGVGSGAYQRETFATEQAFRLATYGTAAHTYRLGSSTPWLRAEPGQVRVPGSAGGRPEAPEPGIGRFSAHFDGSLAFRPGLHSAVLVADDPSTKDPADLEILNTVVTPYTFSARTANTWRLRGAGPGSGIEAEKLRRFFFEVPPGAGALQLSAAGRAAERAGLVMYVTDPLGLPYAVDTDAFVPGRRSELTVPRPQAGTWEVTLHARERAVQGVADRPRDHAVVPFHGWELTAKLLSVELGPASWTVDPAVPGRQVSQAFTATNRGAAFTGAATGTELVSSNRVRREIAGSGGELRFPVTVPAGTTELAASIGNPSDGLADLDLYVYDPSGALYDSDADGDAEERVTVPDPTPGTWQIGVDPYETPRGVTDYDWRVDLARPGLGRIATSDRPEPRPTGSSWNFRASVTVPSTPPPAGWVHAGRVVVTDGSGAEVSDAELTMRFSDADLTMRP